MLYLRPEPYCAKFVTCSEALGCFDDVLENVVPYPTKSSCTRRIGGLDALRGLAALSVILFHYTGGYEVALKHTPGLFMVFPNGHFGVQLFFVISGCVILMTLERSKSLADFAVSRFARLYPAYIACAAVTLAVIFFGHINLTGINLKRAFLNLTLAAPALGRPTIDPSHWTLAYEVLFYAAAGVTSLGFGLRRIEWPCIVWLAIAAVGQFAGCNSRSMPLAVLLNTNFANLFVAGMMVYRLVSARASGLTYATLAAALAMAWFGPDFNGGNMPLPLFAAMEAAFAALVWASATGRLRVLEWRPLLFLGDISYSLYLVHQIAGYWVIQQLERVGCDPNLAIAAALAALIALATAIRWSVEVPAQRAIRGVFARRFGDGATHETVLSPVADVQAPGHAAG